MARDLRQLFDELQATRVDLVGYSMGSIVSLIVASQDKRIRRLVIGGIGAGIVEREGVDKRSDSGMALVNAMNAEDPRTILDPTARGFRTFADRVGGDRVAFAAQLTARYTGHISLDQITAPTLLLSGDKDPLAVRAEVLTAAIPHAEMLVLPGDHLNLVQLPRFASAIVDFLAI